jgi:hypothetical protein
MTLSVRVLTLLVVGTALQGCATTPNEAVELSVTVGRDLEAVHSAHVALAKQHFDRMEKDVNAFVDGTYRPYAIKQNMKDFRLIEKIADPSKADGLDPLKVMEVFVNGLTKNIEDFRRKLLDPVRAQRQEVLTSLEEAYRRVQDGQSIVTGHLASIVKVHEAQDEVLAKAGLAGLRERLVDATAEASDQIAALTRNVELGRGKTDEIEKTIEDLKTATESLAKK